MSLFRSLKRTLPCYAGIHSVHRPGGKTIFLLLAMALAQTTMAQSDPIPDYTISYYPFINRAELSIIPGNYKDALASFDSAFKNVPRAFSRDYFNAAICAARLGLYPKAFVYCDSLIDRGASKDFLLTNEGLESLRKYAGWEKYISSYEVKYRRHAARRNMREVFARMGQRDQEYRVKPGSYRVYKDSIAYADSINIAEVKEIILQRGFPNENMMDRDDPRNIYFPGYIVFHHYCQGLSKAKIPKYNFLPDFIRAVKNGQLDPYRFAFLVSLENSNEIDLGGWGVSVAKLGNEESQLLGDTYAPERLQLIIKNRALYGLCALGDYYRKAVFALKNETARQFAFTLYAHKNIFELEDREQYEKFIEGSVLLE